MLPNLRSAVFLIAWAPKLAAQCPDGSAPPCAHTQLATPAPTSVAVLYFENLSHDTSQAYIADGLTDEVTARLGEVSRLRVTSRAAVRRLRNAATMQTEELGRALNVSYLVSGSVRGSGGRVRVTVELLRASSGTRVWGEQYEREGGDLLGLQEDIAQHVATGIAGRLLPSETARLAARTTGDPAAYDLYLRGRYFWSQRGSGPAALNKAIEFFDKALALDSGYARAWAGLADAYSMLPPFAGASPAEAFGKARSAARRALELDSTLAEAHTSLAIIHVFSDWDWAAAGREFDRALTLDSTEARTHLFHAWYYTSVGRLDDALREVQTARHLEPLSAIITARVGSVLYYLRHYDDAARVLGEALEIDSTNPSARGDLGLVLVAQHRFPDAVAVIPGNVNLQGGYFGGFLGYAYGVSGQKEQALAIQRRLEERARSNYVVPDAFAEVALGLGDTTQALDWLERGYRSHAFYMIFIGVDPVYEPLRGNPRFQRIIQDMGLTIPREIPPL